MIEGLNGETLAECLRTCNFIFVNCKYDIKNVCTLFDKIKEKIERKVSFNEYDNGIIIKELLASLMNCEDQCPTIWDIVIELFNGSSTYFFEEMIAIIKKYKSTEHNNIVRIINKYLQFYNGYNYYVNSLQELLNIFKDDNSYKDDYRGWITKLTMVNPDIINELPYKH